MTENYDWIKSTTDEEVEMELKRVEQMRWIEKHGDGDTITEQNKNRGQVDHGPYARGMF